MSQYRMSYIYLKYAAGVLDLYDLLIANIDDGDVDQLMSLNYNKSTCMMPPHVSRVGWCSDSNIPIFTNLKKGSSVICSYVLMHIMCAFLIMANHTLVILCQQFFSYVVLPGLPAFMFYNEICQKVTKRTYRYETILETILIEKNMTIYYI